MRSNEDYINELSCSKISVDDAPKHVVYVLWDNDEIVYVGKSNRLFSRIETHQKTKEFTHFSYIELGSDIEMDAVESALIYELNPKLNVVLPDFINLKRLRGKIRSISEYHKYSKEFYVRNIKKILENSDIELYEYRGEAGIKASDLPRAMKLIVGGGNDE